MKYYVGTKEELLALDAIITSNCGWPDGRTTHWANPTETNILGVFAIPVPEGSHGFKKEKMVQGIKGEEVENVSFPKPEGE